MLGADEAGGRAAMSDTGRLEAFSDGVFAIAITLLVLELHVPRAADLHGRLGDALFDEWPSYLAFVTSFLTILIMWVNHHNIFRAIRRVDQLFLLLNGLLLMGVSIIPFTTALLAEYIEGSERRAATIVYAGSFCATALCFNRLWAYASGGGRLLGVTAGDAVVRSTTRSFNLGTILYCAAFALAFVNAVACLALTVGLAIFFALPISALRGARP